MIFAKLSWKNRLRHVAVVPMLLAGVVGSTIAVANPAAAAVPGLTLVSAISAGTPTNKSIIAACPAGRTLTGIGGTLIAGNGEVLMDDLLPITPSQVLVAGAEDFNLTTNWSIAAHAICAGPLPAQVRIPAISPANPVNAKSATAICPGGTKLTGSGAGIQGTAAGDVVVTEIVPNGTPDRVTARAVEISPVAASWSVTAWALCAVPLAGQVTVAVTSAATPFNKSATAVCPGVTRLIGTGGAVLNGGGQVGMPAITPNSILTEVTVTGNEINPVAANWQVRAYAICAN